MLISKCYYVTPNRFSFDEGLYYCKNYCNSNLASIHNESQQIEAVATIKSGLEIFTGSGPEDIWIGLKLNENTLEWKPEEVSIPAQTILVNVNK